MSKKPKPVVSHLSGAPHHAGVTPILQAWGRNGRDGVLTEFPYLRAVLGSSFSEADLLGYLADRVRT